MYQNVSDEAISASDSASFIIAQMVAFGIEADNASHIIDAVNETANNFAVSSGQLANSLGIVSSTASAMGNSMEETLGMLTSITEQTRNSSKAARGLNSIFNNLAQVLDDASSNGKKITEIFDSLNISMYDNEGQLLSSYKLLGKLADKWNTLDTNTKNYIASTIAGTNQLNNFLALMNNFEHAVEATETAINSSGSAAKENSRYMESLEAKVQLLRSSFQELSSSIVDSDLVKTILDVGNVLLYLGKTPIGNIVVQAGLISGVLWGGTGLISAMKIIPNLLGKVSKKVSGINALLTLAPSKLFAIGTAISAVLFIIQQVRDYIEKHDLNYLQEQIESNNQELESTKQRLEEINEIPWYDRTSDIIKEREELKKLQKELENTIEKEKEQAYEEAKKKVKRESVEVYTGETYFSLTKDHTDYSGKIYNDIESAWQDAFQAISDSLYAAGYGVLDADGKITVFEDHLQDAIEMAKRSGFAIEEVSSQYLGGADKFEEAANGIRGLIKAFKEGKISEEDFKLAVESNEESLQSWISVIEAYEEQGEKAPDSLYDMVRALKESQLALQVAENLAKGFAGKVALSTEELNTIVSQLSESGAALDEFSSYVEVTNGKINVLRMGLLKAAEAGSILAQELLKAILIAQDAKIYTSATDDYAANAAMLRNKGNKEFDRIVEELRQAGSGLGSNLNLGEEEFIGGGSASQVAEDILEPLKEELEKKEHQIFLLDKQDQVGNANEIINIYKDTQRAVSSYADMLRQQNYAEDSEQIRKLQEIWWGYQDEINSIYDKIDKRAEESRQAQEEEAREATERMSKYYEDLVDKYNDEASAIQALADVMEDYFDSEIQKIDDQINALNESNEKLKDQIELEEKLDNLAKAKNQKVLVYQDGQYQYVSDIDAVSEAEKEYEDYQREQSLNDKIEALEHEKDILKEYKDQWADLTNEYELQQNRRLIAEQLGIDIEKMNFEDMASNAEKFAERYLKAMEKAAEAAEKLEKLKERLDNAQSSSSGTGSSNISSVSSDKGYTITSNKGLNFVNNASSGSTMTGGDGSKWTKNPDGSTTIVDKDGVKHTVKKYASGSLNTNRGLSLVGENGPELRVLNSGDGIIPSEVTKNLWNWGKISPSALLNKGLSNTVVTIQNLNLPNVHNAQDFAQHIKNNFWRKTVQFSTSKN